MFAVLVPILVSALGYVTYELVMMGWNELQEYMKNQEEQTKIKTEGCPQGQVRRFNADGEVSCESIWTACPPPTLPKIAPGGQSWACVPPSMYCPKGTTMKIVGGEIICVPDLIQAQFTAPNLVQAQADPFVDCYSKYIAMGMSNQQALTLCLNRQVQVKPPNLVQAKRKVRVPKKKGGKRKVRVPKGTGGQPSRGARGSRTASHSGRG